MIRLFEDREALARGAAALFEDQAKKAVAAHGRFSVLLAGGETPRRTYQLLAKEPFLSRIPWGNVDFFWGDERCVASDDPRSNLMMARTALLDHIPVRPEQIHPILCQGSPRQAADSYRTELEKIFAAQPPRFDLALLGLGEDGHTASLLPGSEALNEQLRWTAVTRRSSEEFWRVTLTAPLINQAAMVLFLVSGSAKAGVLGEILNGSPAQQLRYPAQLIQPLSGELLWYADREAASMLS